MNFVEYVLTNESNLEDLYVSDDATDNIELLHEMEWKLGQVVDHQYNMNPKMYVNIIKRFANFAFEAYDDLSNKFEVLFEYWLSKHTIEDPHTWAEMVYDEHEDMIDTEGSVFIGGHGIHIQDIVNNMSISELKNVLEYEYGSIEDAFPDTAPLFLQNIEAIPDVSPEELEDYNEPWDYWEDNEDEAQDYIDANNLENQFAEYAIQELKDSGIDAYNFPINKDVWVKGIEELLYPDYYGEHGYNIESVTPEVEEARERLNLTDEYISDGQRILKTLHPDDSDLDKNVERIKKMVGKATSAISLSMNVMHTTGNIMTDYGHVAGLDDVDIDFLEDFNSREIDDWRAELKRIIR